MDCLDLADIALCYFTLRSFCHCLITVSTSQGNVNILIVWTGFITTEIR